MRWVELTHLLGVVEALEVVLAEEAAVGGLAAAAHALAEVQPEVVAAALVPVDAPPRRHRRLAAAAPPPPLPLSTPVASHLCLATDPPSVPMTTRAHQVRVFAGRAFALGSDSSPAHHLVRTVFLIGASAVSMVLISG